MAARRGLKMGENGCARVCDHGEDLETRHASFARPTSHWFPAHRPGPKLEVPTCARRRSPPLGGTAMRTYGKRMSASGSTSGAAPAAAAPSEALFAVQTAAILEEADASARKRPRPSLLSLPAAAADGTGLFLRSSSSLRASGQAAALLQELDYHLVRAGERPSLRPPGARRLLLRGMHCGTCHSRACCVLSLPFIALEGASRLHLSLHK